jgi:hypothetical protein
MRIQHFLAYPVVYQLHETGNILFVVTRVARSGIEERRNVARNKKNCRSSTVISRTSSFRIVMRFQSDPKNEPVDNPVVIPSLITAVLTE